MLGNDNTYRLPQFRTGGGFSLTQRVPRERPTHDALPPPAPATSTPRFLTTLMSRADQVDGGGKYGDRLTPSAPLSSRPTSTNAATSATPLDIQLPMHAPQPLNRLPHSARSSYRPGAAPGSVPQAPSSARASSHSVLHHGMPATAAAPSSPRASFSPRGAAAGSSPDIRRPPPAPSSPGRGAQTLVPAMAGAPGGKFSPFTPRYQGVGGASPTRFARSNSGQEMADGMMGGGGGSSSSLVPQPRVEASAGEGEDEQPATALADEGAATAASGGAAAAADSYIAVEVTLPSAESAAAPQQAAAIAAAAAKEAAAAPVSAVSYVPFPSVRHAHHLALMPRPTLWSRFPPTAPAARDESAVGRVSNYSIRPCIKDAELSHRFGAKAASKVRSSPGVDRPGTRESHAAAAAAAADPLTGGMGISGGRTAMASRTTPLHHSSPSSASRPLGPGRASSKVPRVNVRVKAAAKAPTAAEEGAADDS